MPTSGIPTGPTSSAHNPAVVCAGMVVVDHVSPPMDHMPGPGELIAVDRLILNIGGGAANTAVDLTRLGVGVSICARVGDDILGRFATETLVAGGVDVRALKLDPEHATSQTLVVNVRGEDRRFIHSLGANREFNPADIAAIMVPAPRVLHIGYFLILPKLDAAGLADCLARARRSGTKILLDVATPGPGNYLEPLRAVLPHTDVFVPNTDEAALILGDRDPVRQALAFHEMGARRVVVTRGDRGVISVSDDHRLEVGAYPVEFVDGSGGGDAFDAGYIVGLLEDRPEIECLKLASAVGASAVRAVGTTAGVFTRAEAEEFIGRQKIEVRTI
ncbi:MAG: carbohydrate kinase family protein [Isosphaeraceae bacterium]